MRGAKQICGIPEWVVIAAAQQNFYMQPQKPSFSWAEKVECQ